MAEHGLLGGPANGGGGVMGPDGAVGMVDGVMVLGKSAPRPSGLSPWPDLRRDYGPNPGNATPSATGLRLDLQGRSRITPDLLPDMISLSQSFTTPIPDPRQPYFGWTITNSAIAAVAELAGHAKAAGWNRKDLLAPWPGYKHPGGDASKDFKGDPTTLSRELALMERLADYRDGVMAEALAQRDGVIAYFQGLAGFTAASRPKTTELCIIANAIGQFLVMYHKQVWQRPRPSELLPSLMPPLDVPGHAAYPSGHATESHLIAHFLGFVLPAQHPARPLLHPLADRIALNREVLGFHYRSDSEAGGVLAYEAARIAAAVGLDNDTLLAETAAAAAGEWAKGAQPSWKAIALARPTKP